MKPKVVLDTSALVSALLFAGETARLVSLWEEGRIVPLISKDVLLEYVRVFGYSKFKLSAEDIKRLVEDHVLPFAELVAVAKVPRVVLDDPGDDKFLALAEAGKATHLISGDRHLLKMISYKSVAILSPRQFLESIK
jgi:putative PIN family toxin of toxin-antitoxin system